MAFPAYKWWAVSVMLVILGMIIYALIILLTEVM